MVGKIGIKDYPHKSKCDVNRCTNKSEYSIGVFGESLYFNQNYCGHHLKEIALSAISKFCEDKEFVDSIKESVQFKPEEVVEDKPSVSQIEELNSKIQDLQASIDAKDSTIDFMNDKITELEKKLKQGNKPIPQTVSKAKGKR